MIKSKTKILILILFLVIAGAILSAYFKFYQVSEEKDDFRVNTILLKSVIKQGEKVISELKITNLKDSEQEFQIDVEVIDELVSLSEENFMLEGGEEKVVYAVFEDANLKYEPGVYVGKIIIKTNSTETEIPVILEIQTMKVLFVANLDVSPKYKEIIQGEKFVADIKFFSLDSLKLNQVEMIYFIKNFDGDVIISESENIVIGSESVISKTIILPEDIQLGDYTFIAITKHMDFVSTSSYLFSIKEKDDFFIYNIPNVNLMAIVIFVFLFGIILLVFYMIHERNVLFLQLRKQQTTELRRNLEIIESYRKESLRKARTEYERKKKLEQFEKRKRKIVSKIKAKQKLQRKEIAKLRKRGKKDEISKKLKQWEKEGYNMLELKREIKGISKQTIKEQMDKWKKQGYDIDVLKK